MNRVASVAVRNSCLVSVVALMFAGLCFGQAITLSPTGGPPTTKILVSGSGFSPNAAIDIYFDTTDEALASANGSGSFSKIKIQVPSSSMSAPTTATCMR